ncbi:MAG: glutamate decarboxylase [Thermoleophilia bacterium]|nr:glutamate decarboxylase [Thermoleophilia bacterium]
MTSQIDPAALYGNRFITQEVPSKEFPADGMTGVDAMRLVAEDLAIEGDPARNLATFVTTWMEPEAQRLIAANLHRNFIDHAEYPRTAEIEQRCIRMLADLFHAPGPTTGARTQGSSEAIMLGALSLKWKWRERQEAAGRPTDRPNLVFGGDVHVVWEKFCRYFDVEMRLVDVHAPDYCLTADAAAAACDENTIGVVAILGSTYDGRYEPVQEISEALDRLERDRGIHVPIHVDAASGGFIAPFLDTDLEWDFRLDRVVSINASGHKFGLVYPGVGWVVWRTPADLPEELVFRVAYLGGDMPTFALNFSRPGAQVIAQYYNFVRLGRTGYRQVQQACRDVAKHVAAGFESAGPFHVLTDGSDLPVVAVRMRHDADVAWSVYDISDRLRMHGWQVPAYPMPPDEEDVHVLRIVVRNGFSLELAEMLLEHVREEVAHLQSGAVQPSTIDKVGFHH